MRAHEIITELFSRPTEIEPTWGGGGRFYVGDTEYNARFRNEGDDNFVFDFYAQSMNYDGARFGNTGEMGSKASLVFANIVEIISRFINKYDPQSIRFTGDNESSKGRFYVMMVRYLQNRITASGYEVEIDSNRNVVHFLIKREENPFLDEALNSPSKWQWIKKEISYWTAEFKIGETQYMASFAGFNAISITFSAIVHDARRSGPTQGITGGGNALEVFSTMLEIIRAFVNERKPRSFGFEAKKNQPSRVKLYRKMVSMLNVPGYSLSEDDADNPHSDTVAFTYTNENNPEVPVEVKFDNLDEDLSDYDPPSEHPTSVTNYQGLTFKEQDFQGYPSYYVYKGKTLIGFFYIARHPYGEPEMVIHPDLVPNQQRKGYGTIIYDFAEMLAHKEGRTLMPSGIQSNAAKNFWAKRTSSQSS